MSIRGAILFRRKPAHQQAQKEKKAPEGTSNDFNIESKLATAFLFELCFKTAPQIFYKDLSSREINLNDFPLEIENSCFFQEN